MQIRDRREQNLLLDEIRGAFENIDAIWAELEFVERQYAVRLLVKQIDHHFELRHNEGEMKVELRDFGSRKL